MGSAPTRASWETTVATLRMLLAIAWADGRVDAAEKRALRQIAQSLGLDPARSELFAEELDDDVPLFVDEMPRRPLGRADIVELLDLARAIAAADGHVHPREREALQGLVRLMGPRARVTKD